MSKSYRKPIIKDKPRNVKASTLYWRHVRSAIKQVIRNNRIEDMNSYDLKNIPKETINDYNYCDYKIYPESTWWHNNKELFIVINSRK